MVLALASCLLACAQVVRAASVPGGFVDEPVVSGLNQPTAIAFAPDGRLFICEQGGQLRVAKFDSGTGVWTLLPTPFLQLAVDSSGERGLLGVAFHPSFASNNKIYVYHTVAGNPAHNRISEYTANGDVVVVDVNNAPAEVAGFDIDNLTSATNHNGGAMHFGNDGKLYAAIGDNATGLAALDPVTSPPQTLDNLLGKILRLNSDLTIPTDNPFFGSTTGNNRAIWALGLRNPFTFSVSPDTGRVFINDVGQDTWEEVNDGISASNYGWPIAEGPNPSGLAGKTYALLCYAHGGGTSLTGCGVGTTGTNGCAITGGSFPRSTTDPHFDGDYYFSDYCGGWIKAFHLSGSPSPATDFASGIGAPVDLSFHTDGRLYYLGRGNGGPTDGFVRRVTWTASAAPTITDPPKPVTVSDGHDATFTVGASGAPPLSYQWQRDNVDIGGANGSTYTLPDAQLATDNGAQFHCTVTNAYGFVPSADATLTVTADQPPVPKILTPSATLLYTDGMLIKYSGSATDKEDGAIKKGAQFTWQVDFHHDTHIHPFVQATPGATSGSFVVNSQGHTESNVWLRLILTVTDSGHHSTTIYRDIFPKKVQVTVKTEPPGLGFLLDGQPFTSTTTFTGVTGILRSLSAVAPQAFHHAIYDFWSWSDGGAPGHAVKTPAVNTTYVVSYRKRKTGPRSTP